jgi:SAM-dependent methyltransferase
VRTTPPAGSVRSVASWEQVSPGGRAYADRFARLARRGGAMHGEADLVERLAPAGARVLDAGCGTGRVAIRLAERGFAVAGVDLDPDMLAVAREAAPSLPWFTADLGDLRSAAPGPFDLIVAAGNVVPLVSDGARAIAALRARLAPAGLLVTGFGLDAAHLPVPAVLDLATFDGWCTAAGLTLRDRWATWGGEPFVGGGYAVSVHH